MRLTLLAGNESVAKFHDYQRSRMRIARATVLNLALLAPALALFLPIRGDVNWWRACIAVTTTLIAIVVVAKLYRRIEFAYVERLADAYRLEGKSKKRKPDLAAAICWRRKNDILQFRLVRTTSEDKWTFPKGHPKRGENLAETANREAEEEAGVKRGRLKGKRLTVYDYARHSGPDHRVAAFLLEVKAAGLPRKESFRTPQWFAYEEALEKLREGNREEKYAEEHARVLQKAASALEQTVD